MKYFPGIVLIILLLTACENKSYDLDYDHKNLLYIEKSDLPDFAIQQNVYVPAYSDIYYETGDNKTYLTVILSLRNISFTDTIYFDNIEYYGSGGQKLRDYIDKVLMLRPMESMEYILDAADKKGGPGANFVVHYMANESLKNPPLIETIMMGNLDNYRFSFSSRGVEIKE